MGGHKPTLRARFLALALAVLGGALLVEAGGGADPIGLHARANDLRGQNAALASRSHTVLLDLYALEAQLDRARSRFAALRGQLASVAHEQAQARSRLAIARRTLAVSQHRLAARLRALYEQGDVDPLAVVLGATSLDEALTGLEGLDRSAKLDRSVVEQVRTARSGLVALGRSLGSRAARIHDLESAAETAAASLAGARTDRVATIARLAKQRRLNASEISSLEATARAAEAKALEVAARRAAAPSAPAPPVVAPATLAGLTAPADPPPASGSRTLIVVATGYSMPGNTSTGIAASWGVAAVDPGVIPLGSRLVVPGYGEAVAADTGSAVHGAMIDLWFPTLAQALAWGRQALTIEIR